MTFETSTWLRGQWSNPGDIFTILMIIGGDVVQVAIAQLCGGPSTVFTPVVFSFGWVTYAVQAMLSAVGENRLMPRPEVDCCVINAKTGYVRTNYSWILSRILRDFEHWRGPEPDVVEDQKLVTLRQEAVDEGYDPKEVRVGLRVTVWQCVDASGNPRGDWIYWLGFGVAIVQLVLAAIPWILYGEWLIFLVVGVGTLLAFVSGALPQWHKEKFGVRIVENNEKKDIFLTRGNGDHDALLILGYETGMDLEALASPYRELKGHLWTRTLSTILAVLWILLLLSIAGYSRHTWFIMATGIIGILHNVLVAGRWRYPRAFGIDLKYQETIVGRKVMQVLWDVEERYPKAGKALVEEFFPGKLFKREDLLWEYADRRSEAFKEAKEAEKKARNQNLSADPPTLWRMPPLQRPKEFKKNNTDIPDTGEYQVTGGVVNVNAGTQPQPPTAGTSTGNIV